MDNILKIDNNFYNKAFPIQPIDATLCFTGIYLKKGGIFESNQELSSDVDTFFYLLKLEKRINKSS